MTKKVFRDACGLILNCVRVLRLIHRERPRLVYAYCTAALLIAALPVAIAFVGKCIVDHVARGGTISSAARLVVLEASLVAVLVSFQRVFAFCEAVFAAVLAFKVKIGILETTLALEIDRVEGTAFQKELATAREGAAQVPIMMVRHTLVLVQSLVAVSVAAIVLADVSIAVACLIALGGVLSFAVEFKFSGDAFRLFSWKASEAREQSYIEGLVTRQENAKEIRTLGLGPYLLERYTSIFHRTFEEDRTLTLRRNAWGALMSTLRSALFYGAYLSVVVAAIEGNITIGQLTLYFVLFAQMQSATASSLASIASLYEHNLYIEVLFRFLEQPRDRAAVALVDEIADGDGFRFHDVSFKYPGATRAALSNICLNIPTGKKVLIVGANGSGKTTLIKLLLGLYRTTHGCITLDGLDVASWESNAYRARVAALYQDYLRLQFRVRDNIGVGDVARKLSDEAVEAAAREARASEFISALPSGYDTQLGHLFADGHDLSGGQWQRIALARALVKNTAAFLVLDEPTAAMDPVLEAEIHQMLFSRKSQHTAVVVSHRLGAARLADTIIVLKEGRIVERGDHDSLMEVNEVYASLFNAQARSYGGKITTA